VLGLLVHGLPLQVAQTNQSASEYRNQDSATDSPPIGRRFTLALIAGACLILGCNLGKRVSARGRRRFGSLLIGGGFVLFWAPDSDLSERISLELGMVAVTGQER
jgi:hypothetical protein